MQKTGKYNSSFKDRTGEIHTTNEGYKIEIIQYFGVYDCTIRFEDGSIEYNLIYHNIVKGTVLKSKLGNKYTTKEGYEVTVIDYKDRFNCTVQFKNGYCLKDTSLQNVKNGKVKNPYHPTKFGIGYMGFGDYLSSVNGKRTIHYMAWCSMYSRCYSKTQPSYENITVCEEWHNFQNFAKWYEYNWKPHMEGWHLDKDILVKGNKVYSPETCCLVPSCINNLFKINKNTKHFYERNGKFEVTCCGKYIGAFNTSEEAIHASKKSKNSYIKSVADQWKNDIGYKVYDAIYKWII